MALKTPESSPAESDGSLSDEMPSPDPVFAITVIPSPPLISTHTCNTNLFCCDRLYPLTEPHGPHEQAIYHFAYYMVNKSSSSIVRDYLPSAHSEILEESSYVVRFDRWMNGEKDEIRHFMPHPDSHTSFIEFKPATLAGSSRRDKWVPNWRYLKFRCDVHPGPWFICHVLERRDWREETLEVQAVKRKREVEVQDEPDQDLSSEGEVPAYIATCESAKRRKL